MSYINTYTPPAPVPELDASARWGPDPYDINFAFPLPPDGALENDRVKLTLFIPRVFAEAYLAQVTAHPALQRWLPHTHTSLAQFLSFVELAVRRDPAWALFAVLDTTRPELNPVEGVEGAFAGVIGLLHTSRENLATEIGWVVTFPAFQRSYVTSTAAGLLLRWCLEPGPHGLALRRVQWMANVRNGPSVRAAERLGFRMEGVQRATCLELEFRAKRWPSFVVPSLLSAGKKTDLPMQSVTRSEQASERFSGGDLRDGNPRATSTLRSMLYPPLDAAATSVSVSLLATRQIKISLSAGIKNGSLGFERRSRGPARCTHPQQRRRILSQPDIPAPLCTPSLPLLTVYAS